MLTRARFNSKNCLVRYGPCGYGDPAEADVGPKQSGAFVFHLEKLSTPSPVQATSMSKYDPFGCLPGGDSDGNIHLVRHCKFHV
jgi:hypothetical protein